MKSGTLGAVSEIARLRARITAEHEAACWAVTGLALGTAKHWFITRRMDRIGACQEQLATLVGKQASMAIVAEVLESSPDRPRKAGSHE